MLFLFSLLCLFTIVFNMSFWVFFSFCFIGILFFLVNGYFFHNSFSMFYIFHYDEVSFFMVFILFIVLFFLFFIPLVLEFSPCFF